MYRFKQIHIKSSKNLIKFGGQGVCGFFPLSIAHSSQQTELELILFGCHLILSGQLHEGDRIIRMNRYVALL